MGLPSEALDVRGGLAKPTDQPPYPRGASTILLPGLGSIRLAVEFFIQPAQHARFGSAQRLDPAINQKLRSTALEGNLFGLFHDGPTATQIELVSLGSRLVCFRRCIERHQQLADPCMQIAFGGIVSQCLNNPDREPIFGAVENEDFLALQLALLLLPLKHFLDRRVLDYRDALIVIQEPLDHVRYGIDIDVSNRVALQWRLV